MATITVADAYSDFIQACRADGLSPATVKYYIYALAWLKLDLGDQPLNQVQVNAIRAHIIELRNRQHRYQGAAQRPTLPGSLSVETIRAHIRSLKRFFNWSYTEYGLEQTGNPMNKIRMPRAPRQLPKAIALEDLRKLLMACDESRIGKRNKALLAFLADTGCRAGGALSLTMNGLFLNHGQAILKEKGDRARVVPFTRYTAELIQIWLDVRPKNAPTIFCSLWIGTFGIMTVSGLNQMIKRLAAKAGVTGRCNPHSFRHGFARMYLQHGGDLATLAQIMGHSTVNVTTQFYAVFTSDELARRHEMFSPLRDL